MGYREYMFQLFDENLVFMEGRCIQWSSRHTSAHAYHMIRPLGDAWQDMRKLLERVLSCESVDKSMKQTAP